MRKLHELLCFGEKARILRQYPKACGFEYSLVFSATVILSMTGREYGIINTTEHKDNGFLEKKMGTSSSRIIEQVNGLRASHRITGYKHTLWFDVRVAKKSFFVFVY